MTNFSKKLLCGATRVGKTHSIHISPLKHFDLTQVCILPFSNIERGNGGADTYSVDITVIISCSWVFATLFVHGCRFGS